jgi:phenylalanyl-tRNA synthetase alpha chain
LSQSSSLRHETVSNFVGPVIVHGKEYQRDEWTNVTPKIISFCNRLLYKDKSNPIGLISAGIQEFFHDYDHFSYPDPVVTPEDNFDSLLIPKDHVSRSKSDTYYLNKDFLLRCHTSCHQGHCLKKGSRSFISIADVYRRDAVDRTHHPVFHQCEGLKLFEMTKKPVTIPQRRPETHQEHHSPGQVEVVVSDLKQTLESYVRKLLGKEIEIRWVPAFFPFTHPSFELEILLKEDWIEILGCGVVENKLLINHGVTDSIGWAFGVGLERLAMIKYSIPDIRLFWSEDTGFTSQFKDMNDVWQTKTYKPVSTHPQCKSDISFWLPLDQGDYTPNDFYDLARSIGGDIIEQIELVDDFLNKKTGRRSHCYRIIYRSHERTLTQREVNEVHAEIGKEATKRLCVDVRG